MNATENRAAAPDIVSREEWLAARKAHLQSEKRLTHQRDELARQRRALPWVRVEKSYVFDGPGGKTTLADLFDGRSQLLVYHFMFGPDWAEGCPSCSMIADQFDATRVHLAQRDVTLLTVSRAPLAKLEAFRQRMGWQFPWVSSHGSDFNHDFGVWFTAAEMAEGNFYNYGTSGYPVEEAHGISVFYQCEAGKVFHTYSSYGRGCEEMLGVYSLLDRVPKGRDEDSLAFPMAWVRHHDRYERPSRGEVVTTNGAKACCH